LFNHLGTNITNNVILKSQAQDQTRKATRLAGCMRDMLWDNKYLRIETKVKIYKNNSMTHQ
jgi:hypothetical protein